MGLGQRIFFALALVTAVPASVAAQPFAEAIQIPEPGDLGLFLIGVAGLLIGRWTSRARKRNRE